MNGEPLWVTAWRNGLLFGSSTSTRLEQDVPYTKLLEREAAIVFTEDDLLWYKLRPEPGAELDFSYADQFIDLAESRSQLVFGAHLVWDEGFGDGWTDEDLWGMDEFTARDLLLSTIGTVVKRYRGRVAAWSVANEVIASGGDHGLRTDVPWYETIGPSYVADSFTAAAKADPDAVLVLNEFGFETDDDFDRAVAKRRAALQVIDALLDAKVPVHALGVQAHLQAATFAQQFDADAYAAFLADVAARGLEILITEMDVLDDGLPADAADRDRAVADAYRGYLDVALAEPAVSAVMTFGLTDRYTWLQEDFPRKDGAARRPLPYDGKLRPKPAYDALRAGLDGAAARDATWQPVQGRCDPAAA